MTSTELVFRRVGERTADLALELAIERIRPDRVHVIDGMEPLAAAVEAQLRLDHHCDQVVYVDADCLILDDMWPFLQGNDLPYVDCFVTDRFRGRIHCGVHITRIDVVREMARVEPSEEDPKHVLRPESRRRSLALGRLGLKKSFRNFDVLHDFFQHRRDLYAKYALRELRSRHEDGGAHLDWCLVSAGNGRYAEDVVAARLGVAHAREVVEPGASPRQVASYLSRLRHIATEELTAVGVVERGSLDRVELEGWLAEHPDRGQPPTKRPKVFGIGLSRTGTRSLSMALHVLGYDTFHYPADATTFQELSAGRYDLSLLSRCDGITDITVAPYYAQLDRHFPGSKFVLTVRDKEAWLQSARYHWQGRSAFEDEGRPRDATYMNVRRLLRAAVYGCYDFEEERFSWVYDLHVRNVRDHFRDRPDDLLELDICGADGWAPLCGFLDRPEPARPFPHRGLGASKAASSPRSSSSGAGGGSVAGLAHAPPTRASALP